MNHIKQTLKKITQGIKAIDSTGTQLLASSLEKLLHSIVSSYLNNSALLIQHIGKTMMTSLENQLNRGFKMSSSAKIANRHKD